MSTVDWFSVKDRVIWVTGSSRGIGLGVGRHLLEQGARVVFHSRNIELLNDLVADLGGSPEVTAVSCDVRDPEQVRDAVAEIGQAHDGSLGAAHAYVDAVAKTGAQAVKFQTHIDF